MTDSLKIHQSLEKFILDKVAYYLTNTTLGMSTNVHNSVYIEKALSTFVSH